MGKHKDSYPNKCKNIVAHLLLSILSLLLLFENCNQLDSASISIDSQFIQDDIHDETMLTYDEQSIQQVGFSNLPLELLVHMLSFLDPKNFHRASLVSNSWRNAAFIAGEEKALNLSYKRLNQKDCQALLKVPFYSLILKGCLLGPQELRMLAQSTSIKCLNLYRNRIGDEGARILATGNLPALTCLNLQVNRIGNEGAKALAVTRNLPSLTSLALYDNNMGPEGKEALKDKKSIIIDLVF